MTLLIFQLAGAMAGFGEIAIGESRYTLDAPSHSNILGLMAAALGIRRDQEAALQSLQAGYRIAVVTLESGHLLRDYHTAQVAGQSDLKHQPLRTRQDELNVAKEKLNTILSTRDYRSDGHWLVVVEPLHEQVPYTLEQLCDALQRPKYTLFLGRKSCPLAQPIAAQIMTEQTVVRAAQAFLADLKQREAQLKHDKKAYRYPVRPKRIQQLFWDDAWTIHEIGVDRALFVALQQDRLLSRQRWQYGERLHYVATLNKPQIEQESA
jgi:CRISPR system Cascade subunit CasD